MSEFLYAFIYYAFHLENYAQLRSLFEGYDSFTEWEYRMPGIQYMSAVYQKRVCVFGLQQLQGVEAVKHPLRQVGDLISIQHAGKSQHSPGLDTRNDIRVDIYAQTWFGGHLQGV